MNTEKSGYRHSVNKPGKRSLTLIEVRVVGAGKQPRSLAYFAPSLGEIQSGKLCSDVMCRKYAPIIHYGLEKTAKKATEPDTSVSSGTCENKGAEHYACEMLFLSCEAEVEPGLSSGETNGMTRGDEGRGGSRQDGAVLNDHLIVLSRLGLKETEVNQTMNRFNALHDKFKKEVGGGELGEVIERENYKTAHVTDGVGQHIYGTSPFVCLSVTVNPLRGGL
ncbi:hypothetical protein INR49_017625 [Caranx melampygus]|nr:hypothetical protein INR49_017625 [Caranx melampygus]